MFLNNNGNLVVEQKHLMCIVLLAITALFITSFCRLTAKGVVSISILDVIVSVYILYIIVNGCVHNSFFIQQARTPCLLIPVISYLLFRWMSDAGEVIHIFLRCYFYCSIVLLVYGYLQLFHVVDSNHEFFLVSGPFHNPAPYACQLSLTAIITAFFIFSKYKEYRSIKKYDILLLGVFFILNVCLLAIVASRSAIITVVVCVYILVFFKLKRIHKLLLLLALILSLPLLYLLREDSANGRILIWKVCMFLVSKNSLSGIGYNNFVVGYNMRQAEYFSTNAATGYETFIADTAYHPFNEFLLILVEEGIVGLLIFCSIIYLSLRAKHADNIDLLVKVLIVALLLFGCFSYPLNYPCFNILLFVCIAYCASLSSDTVIINGIYKIKWILCLLTSLIVAVYIYSLAQAVYRWNNATQLDEYDQLYPRLKYNGLFLTNYGIVLYRNENYEKASLMLNDAKKYFINAEMLIYSGDAYRMSGCLRESQEAYMLSSYMAPNRLAPNYKLAELFFAEGDTLHALGYAEKVLNMPIKIDNEAGRKIVSDAEILIYQIHHPK
jgi:O-antigen polymerase